MSKLLNLLMLLTEFFRDDFAMIFNNLGKLEECGVWRHLAQQSGGRLRAAGWSLLMNSSHDSRTGPTHTRFGQVARVALTEKEGQTALHVVLFDRTDLKGTNCLDVVNEATTAESSQRQQKVLGLFSRFRVASQETESTTINP